LYSVCSLFPTATVFMSECWKPYAQKPFHHLVFAKLLLCDAALQYHIAGQAATSGTVWCQLLTVWVGTELKTPQTLTGKRKWRDWALSWTPIVHDDEVSCLRSISTQQDSVLLECDIDFGCTVPMLCSSTVYWYSRSGCVSVTAWSRISKHYIPLNYCSIHSQSHSVTSYKTWLFSDTTARTSYFAFAGGFFWKGGEVQFQTKFYSFTTLQETEPFHVTVFC
jgi:hypothetical protein